MIRHIPINLFTIQEYASIGNLPKCVGFLNLDVWIK
jgi:hypothetical protein